jgi:hypothetical protein
MLSSSEIGKSAPANDQSNTGLDWRGLLPRQAQIRLAVSLTSPNIILESTLI